MQSPATNSSEAGCAVHLRDTSSSRMRWAVGQGRGAASCVLGKEKVSSLLSTDSVDCLLPSRRATSLGGSPRWLFGERSWRLIEVPRAESKHCLHLLVLPKDHWKRANQSRSPSPRTGLRDRWGRVSLCRTRDEVLVLVWLQRHCCNPDVSCRLRQIIAK